MTKTELLKKLEEFDDDAVVIIGTRETGWCNIGRVAKDGSQIAIIEDSGHPFTSETMPNYPNAKAIKDNECICIGRHYFQCSCGKNRRTAGGSEI